MNSYMGGVRWTVAMVTAALVAVPLSSLDPAPGAAAFSGNTSTESMVTTEAWEAGRAIFGAHVTPTQAVTAYWTPRRMRAATPIEESSWYRSMVERYQRAVPGSKRSRATDEPNEIPPDRQSHTVEPYRPPMAGDPHTSANDPKFPASNPTARTSGKVFFKIKGVDYVCSGTVVNSEGQNTVWTAGHCVHGGKGSVWATDWQFVPGFDDDLPDPRPYGTWVSGQLWSRTNWVNTSDFSEDMGVAITSPNGGNKIVSSLGAQGLRTGVGREVEENAFGYPAEAPFDGGNLYQCSGMSSVEWQVMFSWSETIKIPCDMTRGSSGGGWLQQWDGEWGYLNGVNSRIDQIQNPTIMLSPYFDETAWSLYDATQKL